jgi:hypothetical protein
VALTGLVAVAAVLGVAGPGVEPARAAAAPESSWTVGDLGLLSGCWRSGEGASYFEEIFTEPLPNMILGLSRFVRDGRGAQFELTSVLQTEDGVVMLPYPSGRPSEHGFLLTSLSATEAIFEAPEHDYPKRILYRSHEDGTRSARIDGGADDDGGQEWRFQRVACPGE